MTILPQLSGDGLFVTDGGLETELVFHDGIDLACFAAFPLLADPDSRARLRRYYDGYLDIARRHSAGFVMETPTWRANPDWAERLGYSPAQLDDANRAAIALAEEVRAAAVADGVPTVVSGCIGPRGDGYDPDSAMTAEEAEDYHRVQIGTFADTSADQVTAITMTNAEEAIGIVKAAAAAVFRRRSRSPSRPTAGFRRASRCMMPIDQVDAATDAGRPTSWSTARTRRISRLRSNTKGRGGTGSSVCARTPHGGVTPSSTRQPNSTRATRASSALSTPRCRTGFPR